MSDSTPPAGRPAPPLALPDYAELRCVSNFSFLRGASLPEELVERARALGYQALALTDDASMAGVVRAHVAAKACGLTLLVGSQFTVQADPARGLPAQQLVALATDRDGYGRLCEFITRLRRQGHKGSYRLDPEAIRGEALAGCVLIADPSRQASDAQLLQHARWLLTHFTGRCWLGVSLLRQLDDEHWLYRLRQVAELTAIALVATGDVHLHRRSRKPLQDVMTATRLGQPLAACGLALQGHAEQHLRTRLRLAQTYPADLLAETLRVAQRCRFSLDELKYQYPSEVVPADQTPASHLRRLTRDGAAQRWPQGVPPAVQRQIEHELALIESMRYEHYFLTVHDIVAFARGRGILCQGRGSAANSVVCYCLGVTEVNPAEMSMLFERFISRERNEPPDIDVDFEHERREEVIQYLYAKYGRSRAALTAVAITYGPRSALRDVGKALGVAPEVIETVTRRHRGWDGWRLHPEHLDALEPPLPPRLVEQWMALSAQLIGFPRHLSQHPGGFVLTQGPLSSLVPIENAAMPGRTVIQWDKDDIDALGLLKVDVLALGMLTALRKSMALIAARSGRPFGLADIPREDPATYAMIARADTVGVFQIESRAQMSMLPRLRPRCFYDLVIEVAIVRPGPIQGGMVHPYLRRRQGLEPATLPNPALAAALERTLGVPIFQEQVMQIAMIAAGFSAGEADALRRAMAAWKRKGGLERYHARIVEGMTARGYEPAFAEAIFEQIKGFSEYGFPESHAASFALLVYASAWIKRHHPAEFLAALINAQPLGFYTPRQLVQDARRHGVEVRAIDVVHSHWDCTIEAGGDGPHPAVRLGLRLVSGLPQEAAQRLVAARADRPWRDAQDLALRAGFDRHTMSLLAGADALAGLAGHRRQQVWQATAQTTAPALLRRVPVHEAALALPAAPEGEDVLWDIATTGLSLRRHPLALLRERLTRLRWQRADELAALAHGRLARACGIVTMRQQPETAHGTVFVTLEDETGTVQVIVWPRLKVRLGAPLLQARLMGVKGTWQREGEVCHLVAGHIEDLTPLLGRLTTVSRDFR